VLQLVKQNGDRSFALSQEGSQRILVVDDNPQILAVVREILNHHGFEVITAVSGEDAISMLDLKLDMVICDVMMPDMDGYDFYSELQKNSTWCNIPFLFLTALDRPEQIRRGKELGCDDYLTKPFEPADLLCAVKGKITVGQRRKLSFEERMESQRRKIIQTLSHEFRTPLVAINTGTELLLDHLKDLSQENIVRLLESIQRGGIRLQRLVEDFMTIQQIDAGIAVSTYMRYKRKVLLSDLVGISIERFLEAYSLEQSAIDLELVVEESARDGLVEVYDAHIDDAIRRILSNARKFGGAGSLVTLTVCGYEENLSVKIRDRGIGLNEDVWENAQELFIQIDRDKKEQQGAGLGLAIASYYTEINLGQILFQKPIDGTGLEVELRLPRTF